MYGVGGVPYMGPAQYNQMMQGAAGVRPYDQYAYGNMIPQQNIAPGNQQQSVMQILRGRPVSGIEEARASMIDMDGSMFLFPDTANKRIYTKQINLNGEPEFKEYALVEETKKNITKETKQNNEIYVLKEDFENIIDSLVRKIKTLEGKGINKNVTSVSDDGTANAEK